MISLPELPAHQIRMQNLFLINKADTNIQKKDDKKQSKCQ